MILCFWKWKNCRDRIQISQGLDLGRGGTQGNFMGDGTVLYLDCGVDYMTVCIFFKTCRFYTKKGKFFCM